MAEEKRSARNANVSRGKYHKPLFDTVQCPFQSVSQCAKGYEKRRILSTKIESWIQVACLTSVVGGAVSFKMSELRRSFKWVKYSMILTKLVGCIILNSECIPLKCASLFGKHGWSEGKMLWWMRTVYQVRMV